MFDKNNVLFVIKPPSHYLNLITIFCEAPYCIHQAKWVMLIFTKKIGYHVIPRLLIRFKLRIFDDLFLYENSEALE